MSAMELIPGQEFMLLLDIKQFEPNKKYLLCACINRDNNHFGIFTRNSQPSNALKEIITFQNITEAVTVFNKITTLEEVSN